MVIKAQLDLSSIDKQKLHIELADHCHRHYDKDEAKSKISSFSDLIFKEPKKITRENPLYEVFIGYYLFYFDKRMIDFISHFGTYRRNDEFIEIFLNEYSESDEIPDYAKNKFIEMNSGVMGETTDKLDMLQKIKNLFSYLGTKYIPYEGNDI